MKGYKGMNADMTCRGMKFEVGKTYHVDGEIRPCENGLHFCEKLTSVFDYYVRGSGNRFFEVEASGTIRTEGQKSVASDLIIIRELTDIEVNRPFYDRESAWGDDYGYGYGYSNGNCYGYGYGYGYSNGYGYGNCYGYGYGNGYNGYGDGSGNGSGYNGDGGYGIQRILLYV